MKVLLVFLLLILSYMSGYQAGFGFGRKVGYHDSKGMTSWKD